MTHAQAYPIGTPGEKWGKSELTEWHEKQSIKRSYRDEIINRLEPLREHFDAEQYGQLSYDAERYPLYAVKTRYWNTDKPTVLVTGGVHGYETSGVRGAVRFLEKKALLYADRFNVVVVPCVSPWAYETVNRWNPNAVDPNRSFYDDSPCEEADALMRYVASLQVCLVTHIDLHETTDSDNSEFRVALAARDGVENSNWNIPDGFYLVGDIEKPVPALQKAIIDSVEKVTHIAPPDENGNIIGEVLSQWGLISYAAKALGLCIGFSNATYCSTTEVYPDSSNVDDEICILAQVAAIVGALDYTAGAGAAR